MKCYHLPQPPGASGSSLNRPGFDKSTHAAVRSRSWASHPLLIHPSHSSRISLGSKALIRSLPPHDLVSAKPMCHTLHYLIGCSSLALECKPSDNRDPRQYSLLVKGWNPAASANWTWVQHLVAVWPWASSSTSSCFSFLICDNNTAYLTGLLWEISELICLKHL